MTRKHAFAPVADERTRVLILGSLPGELSLAAGRYYANPRNAFWRLMEGVLGEPVAALDYPERLNTLLRRGVGLWDSVASAERHGSLDAAIRAEEAADLPGLAATLPQLAAVAFNGAAAAKISRANLPPDPGFALVTLPSSSPALAVAFEKKLEAWTALRRYLS